MRKEAQTAFSGGINLFHDDFRLGETEYGAAFNVRNRRGSLRTIFGPQEDPLNYTFIVEGVSYNGVITGKKQGCYGFGEYILLFAAGYAYYKHFTANVWQLIPSFKMDSNVSYIYVQDVPETRTSYNRVLQSANVINGTSADTRVNLVSNLLIAGVPSGLVVQDGINQPYFMYVDPSGVVLSRPTLTYDQWTMANREYVPIGLNMAVVDGILFIVAPDRKSIYRSVSGRMLDFVVNVTMSGDKGGNATTTSYACSALDITAIRKLKSGQLLVGTIDGCHPITINYDRTIFGEPTFKNPNSFSAGIVNQFSFAELLNDYTFIDKDGIRSYNAISAINDEGRNSLISAYIHKAIDGILQNNACACVFDNYAMFHVFSRYGYIVLIYDMLSEKWVSMDRFNLAPFKMFASVNNALGPLLYAITEDRVYILFGSQTALTASVTLKQCVAADAKIEYKLDKIRLIFDEITEDLVMAVKEVVDNRTNATIPRTRYYVDDPPPYPLTYPIYYNISNSNRKEVFNFKKLSKQGTKVGVEVSWTGDSSLMHCQFELDEITNEVPLKQQASV